MHDPAHPPINITRVGGFGRGTTETFAADEISLGTDGGCDMRFDPTWDKTVNARHAVLRWTGSELWLEDQSRDGSWIDGQRVARRTLTNGTVVELGKGGPRIRVEFESVPVTSQPSARRVRSEKPFDRSEASLKSQRPATDANAEHPSTTTRPLLKDHPFSPGWRGKPVWLWALAAALIAGLAFIFVLPAIQRANADEKLAEYSRLYENAVGLVVLVLETDNGPRSIPMATAWAIGPHTFATNSHVADPVGKALAQGGSAFVILNRHPEQRFRVAKAAVHPKYDKPLLNFEGREPAVPPYDVGLLEVEGTAPAFFKIAPRRTLERLDSGDRIAFLGFPMEGLAGGGVDFRNPVANMQSGIVTSVTDYWLSKANPADRLLIQHNLGAAGGASGSPVFNPRGEVVGILSAGNIIGQVNLETGETTRAPSGVMINFAQRIDVLRDIYPAYPRD